MTGIFPSECLIIFCALYALHVLYPLPVDRHFTSLHSLPLVNNFTRNIPVHWLLHIPISFSLFLYWVGYCWLTSQFLILFAYFHWLFDEQFSLVFHVCWHQTSLGSMTVENITSESDIRREFLYVLKKSTFLAYEVTRLIYSILWWNKYNTWHSRKLNRRTRDMLDKHTQKTLKGRFYGQKIAYQANLIF